MPALSLAAAMLAAQLHCSNDTHLGKSRLLDEACSHGACELSGHAQVISGPTADSTGIRVGPGTGSVRIPIPSFSHAADDSYEIDLLVAGRGAARATLYMKRSSCDGTVDGGVPSDSGCLVPVESTATLLLESEYDWVAVGGSSGASTGSTLQGLAVSWMSTTWEPRWTSSTCATRRIRPRRAAPFPASDAVDPAIQRATRRWAAVVLSRCQRLREQRGVRRGATGQVAAIQLFGGSLNPNQHQQVLGLDGVFSIGGAEMP